MTEAARAIRQWLGILDAGARMNAKQPFESGYFSPAGLVLGLGREMLPSRARPTFCGAMKQCFYNAQSMVWDDPKRYQYAEGWAVLGDTPLPVLHAWCLTRSGRVVDPTWCGRGRAHYYGVAIANYYVIPEVLRSETWHSILDDWEEGFKLLSTPGAVEKFVVKHKRR